MNKRRAAPSNGFPTWVNITISLALLGLLGWNIVFVGPEGYPTSIILGGLLGAYAGLDQFLKKKADDDSRQDPPGGGGKA